MIRPCQLRATQAQAPELPQTCCSCERTSRAHLPQHVATPSSLRSAFIVVAPCAMVAASCLLVTAWQMQTYMANSEIRSSNANDYHPCVIGMQVVRIYGRTRLRISCQRQVLNGIVRPANGRELHPSERSRRRRNAPATAQAKGPFRSIEFSGERCRIEDARIRNIHRRGKRRPSCRRQSLRYQGQRGELAMKNAGSPLFRFWNPVQHPRPRD